MGSDPIINCCGDNENLPWLEPLQGQKAHKESVDHVLLSEALPFGGPALQMVHVLLQCSEVCRFAVSVGFVESQGGNHKPPVVRPFKITSIYHVTNVHFKCVLPCTHICVHSAQQIHRMIKYFAILPLMRQVWIAAEMVLAIGMIMSASHECLSVVSVFLDPSDVWFAYV